LQRLKDHKPQIILLFAISDLQASYLIAVEQLTYDKNVLRN